MKIALASFVDLPDWQNEDKSLVAELESLGATVQTPAWTAEIDWSEFDSTIIRTTWDYHKKSEQYLDWASSVPRLFNPFPIVKWNINKSYLRELESKGIPIAPTVWTQNNLRTSMESVIDQLQIEAGFIKPLVGACASDTMRFNVNEVDQAQSFLDARIDQEMMVQPYLRSVESEGELSGIFVAGEFTHGVQKIPVQGDYRVQDDFGAEDRPYTFTKEEIHAMEDIFNHVPDADDLLYARVDYLRADNGSLLLNELELIEPSMFFRHSDDGHIKFAEAIMQTIN